MTVVDNQGYGDDFIATATIAQLRKLTSVDGDVADEKVALPADPGAHRMRYRLKVNASLTSVATLYIVNHGSKSYSITMSAVESQVPGLEDTFVAIAQSITFTP